MSKQKFIKLWQTHVVRPGATELLEWINQSDFFEAPASTRFHGAWKGGLCQHSLNVWDELVRLLKAYPEIKCSAETAAIITLCHDLCKIGCYKIEYRNAKENNVWVRKPFYKFDEDMHYGGHGSKSVFLVQRFMDLTEEEAVAINCHMGFADRAPGDYSLGAAYEQHPLAWLLHVADEAASYLVEAQHD